MHVTLLHRSLANHLRELPEQFSVRALLESVQRWLRSSKRYWSVATWRANQLDRYLDLDIGVYPTEDAEIVALEELRVLRDMQPHSEDALAMVIEGLMWDGLTTRSSRVCPRCGEPGMRILGHPATDAIVVGCERCGWKETPRGDPFTNDAPLEPATREQLRSFQADQSRR